MLPPDYLNCVHVLLAFFTKKSIPLDSIQRRKSTNAVDLSLTGAALLYGLKLLFKEVMPVTAVIIGCSCLNIELAPYTRVFIKIYANSHESKIANILLKYCSAWKASL